MSETAARLSLETGSGRVRCLLETPVKLDSAPVFEWAWSKHCTFLNQQSLTAGSLEPQTTNNGWVSEVKLSQLSESSRTSGCVNCTVTTVADIFSKSLTLSEEEATSIYVMISGVIGGLMAILAIAFAYFCLNRKYLCRRKPADSEKPKASTARRESHPLVDPNQLRRTSLAYVWDGEQYVPVLIPEEVEETLRKSMPEASVVNQSESKKASQSEAGNSPPSSSPLALYPITSDANVLNGQTDQPPATMFWASPTYLPMEQLRTLETVQETSTPDTDIND